MNEVGEGMGARGCLIDIKDMYNNDGGQGGARDCEAHEAKQRLALVRVPFYFINIKNIFFFFLRSKDIRNFPF